MSGLLDKAKASKTDADEATSPKEVVNTPDKVNSSSKDTLVTAVASPTQNPELARNLNIAGWAGILLGGILALQGGSMGLLVVSAVLVVGIGLLVQSERLAEGDMNMVKLGISIFLAVIVAAGPYAALVLIPSDSSLALTEIQVNEDSDELTFYVRGSFSSATATITLSGESVWSDTLSLTNDRAKFKAPLTAFFDGNAQNYQLSSMKSYMIEVTSSDDQTTSAEITPELMNREVLDSGARISEVLKTQTSGSSSETTVDGVIVESIMGLFSPDERTQDNGEHTMTNLKLIPIASDYTMQLRVKYQGSTEYSSPIISVDGLDATWTSTVGGSKSGKTNGWLGLPGTATDALNTEYLQRDSFYQGSGCYTFEIVVTNEYYSGMTDSDSSATGIIVSENSWDLNFDGNSDQRTMEVC